MGKIMAGSFIPLPVAPVVIVGARVGGKPNFTTVGFVSGVNIDPPIVCVSLNNRHYTPEGIVGNGTFSINIPSAVSVGETDYCGLVSGRTVDKSKIFTVFYGELETAPMIEECPIVCECRYTGKKIDFSMDTVYFGEVHRVYLDENVGTGAGDADIMKANPLFAGFDMMYRTAGGTVGRAYDIGWTYGAARETPGADSVSGSCRCRIVDRPARNTLSIRFRGTMENIPRITGEALAAVARHAGESGIGPSGAPFIAYRGSDGWNMDLEIGFPFERKLDGNGTVQPGEIPGGISAVCTHTGPYDGLPGARAAMHRWIQENGRESAGVSYEFYLNDPERTPPEKLETQIEIPLKSAL